MITFTGVVAAAAVAWLGRIDLQSPWLYVVTFFVGAGVIAGQGGLHALSAMTYPTHMRATGYGWRWVRVGSAEWTVPCSAERRSPDVGGLQSFLAAGLPMLLAGPRPS